MKSMFKKLLTFYFFFLSFLIKNTLQFSDKSFQNFNTYPESDKELEEIRINMYKYADEVSKKSDIYKKRIEIGELPDSFPDAMRRKAKKVRLDREKWNPVMLFPTAVWRMCLFPTFKINYILWCNQKLALSKTKIKLNGNLYFSFKVYK